MNKVRQGGEEDGEAGSRAPLGWSAESENEGSRAGGEQNGLWQLQEREELNTSPSLCSTALTAAVRIPTASHSISDADRSSPTS